MPPRIFIDRNKRAKGFFTQMIRDQTRERVMIITDASPYIGGTGKTVLGRELENMTSQDGVEFLSVDCRVQRGATINQFELMLTVLLDLDPSLQRFPYFNSLDAQVKQIAYDVLAKFSQEGPKPVSSESDLATGDDFQLQNIDSSSVVIIKRDLVQLTINGIISDDTLQRERYERRLVYQKTFLNELALYTIQEGGMVLFFDHIDCQSDLQEWANTFCALLGKKASTPLYIVLMGHQEGLPDLSTAKAFGQVKTFELDLPLTSEKDFMASLLEEDVNYHIPYTVRRQIRKPDMSFHQVWDLLDECISDQDYQGIELSGMVQTRCPICMGWVEVYDGPDLLRCPSCDKMIHLDCYTAFDSEYKCCSKSSLRTFAYELDKSWPLYCSTAIPHWFDKNMLSWVWENPVQNRIWQKLLQRSAITPYVDQTYRMHDAARGHIWQSILVVDKGSLAWRWNYACAVYFAKCTGNLDVLTELEAELEMSAFLENLDLEEDSGWKQRASVELLYHLLLIDWNHWLPVAYNEFETARVVSDFNLCSVIREYTAEVAQHTKRPPSIEMSYFDLAIDKLRGMVPCAELQEQQLALQEVVARLDLDIFHNRRLFQDISNLIRSEKE